MDDKLVIYKNAIGCSIDKLAKEIFDLIKGVSGDIKIYYRIKNSQILEKKMVIKGAKSVFDIDDVYGFRILTLSVGEIQDVSDIITKTFPCFLDHDYLSKPKTRSDKPHLNGKSLRLLQIIAYRNSVPFEIQITTFEFNELNELLHNEYHFEKYHKRPI